MVDVDQNLDVVQNLQILEVVRYLAAHCPVENLRKSYQEVLEVEDGNFQFQEALVALEILEEQQGEVALESRVEMVA
jgi:hypothetical protein